MDLSLFHFSHAEWLWGILVIPLVLALYELLYGYSSERRFEQFADPHLLPHLVKTTPTGSAVRRRFALWSFAWFCGMVAMAGPQWRYTETPVFKPTQNLVIVLDLSSSMNASDVKPSRLMRAREEITDLVNMNRGLTIGLVAYAAVPHMVLPLTDDMNTIRNLLPSLDTSLITIQGDRLKPALAMAARMLGAEPGKDKSILVIGDGDFEENNMHDLVEAAGGIPIYTMGVGTEAGAPVPGNDGAWIKNDDGKILIDQLKSARLQDLSEAGRGMYVEANYSDSDTRAILQRIGTAADSEKIANKTIRTWDEGFYIPALILALMLLPLFRKGYLLSIIVLIGLLAIPTQEANAAEVADWFRNPDQQALSDFDQGRYSDAAKKFSDPYQQGVAAYRAKQFDRAADLFKTANEAKPEPNTQYNLGNAQLMQGKPGDAIKNFEAVLKQRPEDASAKHNLEIAKKMLAQKQQEQQKQSEKNQQKASDSNSASNSGSQSGDKQNKSSDKDGHSADQNQQKAAEGSQQTGQNTSQPAQNKPQPPQGGGKSDQSQNASQANKGAQKQENGAGDDDHQNRQKDAQGDQQSGQGAGESQPQPRQSQSARSQSQEAQTQQPPQTSETSQQQAAGSAAKALGNENQSTAAVETGAGNPLIQPGARSVADRPRTQQDINADQWLNHIQSDPGAFLKNQFLIEERESRGKQEDEQ